MYKAFLLALIWFCVGFGADTLLVMKDGQDLQALATGYGSMFNMCEQKYQAALHGDMNTATMLKDDINQAQANINKLLK